MKYLRYTFLLLFLSMVLVSANTDSLDLTKVNGSINKFEANGEVDDFMINNIQNFPKEEKEKIAEKITKDSTQFWNAWDKEFSGKDKNSFMKELSTEQRKQIMTALGENKGVTLTGFESTKSGHGSGGVLGSGQGYFDLDKVESYNKNAKEGQKITDVSFKSRRGAQTITFTKESGAKASFKTAKEQKGFYFDPESGDILKMDSNGVVDKKSKFSGKWDGDGILEYSVNEDQVNLSIGYARDEEGEITSANNYAVFTASNGERYSVFANPTGEKDEEGKVIYDRNDAKVSFNNEGDVTHLDNIYKKGGKWGGFFGKDIDVNYDKESYDNNDGSSLLIDEKTGLPIASKGATKKEGVGGSAIDYLRKEAAKVEADIKELSDALNARGSAQNIALGFLTEAQRESTVRFGLEKKFYDRLENDYGITKKQVQGLKHITGFSASVAEVAVGQFLDAMVESEGESLRYIQDYLGASADVVEGLSVIHPAIAHDVTEPGVRMDVEIYDPSAEGFDSFEMGAGTRLFATDNNGQKIKIADSKAYGTYFPGDLNAKRPSFSGTDFVITGKYSNQPDSQYRIHADSSGSLEVTSLREADNFKSVSGDFNVNAGGTVSYSGRFGVIKGQQSKSEHVLTATYEAPTTNIDKANEFRQKSNQEYADLYYKYEEGGFTKAETEELTMIHQANYLRYNRILNQDGYQISVNSKEIVNQNLGGVIKNLASGDSLARGASSAGKLFDSPDINMVLGQGAATLFSDKNLQGQFIERGITSADALKTAAQSEILGIANFLEQNKGSQITIDKSRDLMKITSGGNSYIVDQSFSPIVGDLLPMLASSAGLRNGEFYIDRSTSRFGRNVDVFVNGGHYRALYALRNKDAIEASSRKKGQEQTLQALINPGSGVQVYKGY